MTLAFSKVGTGTRTLLLVHGFLGAGRNLTTLARRLVALAAILIVRVTLIEEGPAAAASELQHAIGRVKHEGVTLFVGIGTGNALTGMIKRTVEGVKCLSVQKPDDFAAAKAAIAEARA